MTDPHPETGQADPGVSPTDASALRVRIAQLRDEVITTLCMTSEAKRLRRMVADKLAALLTPTDTEP